MSVAEQEAIEIQERADKRRELREELGPLLAGLSLKYGGTPADFHDHILPAILAHGVGQPERLSALSVSSR